MGRLGRIYGTSIGSKATVAITGLLLFLFLLGHLSGNLLVFGGRDAINSYGEFLRSKPQLLWGARIGLLALLLVHVVTTVRLVLANSAARPVGYARNATVQATLASRYMIHTGIVVAAFIVYHLLHFTLHVVDTGGMRMEELADGHTRFDVYGMLISGFSQPAVAISYVVAMVLLGFHLIHGLKSLFQTLGWTHPSINPLVAFLAPALTLLIVFGNCLIPLSILFGARP